MGERCLLSGYCIAAGYRKYTENQYRCTYEVKRYNKYERNISFIMQVFTK